MSVSKGPRVQVPVRLEPEWLERLDRLIWHTGKGRSKQVLLEQGIKDLIVKIEQEENKGKQFPTIPEKK